MFRPALQPELFDRRPYHALRSLEAMSVWPHSERYRRWCNSPRRDDQRHEVARRQHLNCDHCGQPLGRWYDLHHTSYEHLGYEEASDLVAVHRKCHRQLEESKREACGCARAVA